MQFSIHVYHHFGDVAEMEKVLHLFESIRSQIGKIMASLDDLKVQVQKNTDAEQSAIVLLNGLSAKLAAIATDPLKVQALSDELKTSADSLAAAVVANTPAEDPAPPPG